MKKVINFHKAYPITIAVSGILIAVGIVGLVVSGFNLGVDFRAGINKTVQMAYPAMTVSYSGKGNAELTVQDAGRATVVFSGADIENRTYEFLFSAYPTVGALADAFRTIPEVSVSAVADATLPSSLVLPSYEGSSLLSVEPIKLYRGARGKDEVFSSLEDVRSALSGIAQTEVQVVGGRDEQKYMIRINEPKNDAKFASEIDSKIMTALSSKFGKGEVVSITTQRVAERFSKTLADQSVWVILITVALIMLYATIRFKIEFAIGAILAILHDALIMVGFMVWTRMEFNISSIAAILTILGYSINDTIVIFDRIRENRKLNPDKKMHEVLNLSITEMLGRTFITTGTTMLCVFSLFFFTTGSMKDFSLALLVGMVSGTYSTIFMATWFVDLWHRIKEKRAAEHAHAAKTAMHSAPKK